MIKILSIFTFPLSPECTIIPWMGRAGFEPATFCTSSSFKALNGEISVDWGAFRKWAKSRYAKSYAPTVYGYAEKFGGLLFGNLAELYSFSRSKRGAILRALSALSKYLGVHEQFKRRMKDYGMKWESQSSFDSFLRIINSENKGDVVEWVKRCLKGFDHTYAVFVKFALFTGIRKGEAIEAFNLIVRLGQAGTPYVEMPAVMAKYNPFAEKAGMRKIAEQPPSKEAITIAEILQKLGFNIHLLGSEKYILNKLQNLKAEDVAMVREAFIITRFQDL